MNLKTRLDRLAANAAWTRPTTRAAKVRQQMDRLTTPERVRRCARVLFEAQTERAPSDDELNEFITTGDYHRAMDDAHVFERLEGQATKEGRMVTAASWRSIAYVLAQGEDLTTTRQLAVFDAVLRAILTDELLRGALQ